MGSAIESSVCQYLRRTSTPKGYVTGFGPRQGRLKGAIDEGVLRHIALSGFDADPTTVRFPPIADIHKTYAGATLVSGAFYRAWQGDA